MYADYDFLFCDELGKFISPQSLYKAFKRALNKSGLPNVRFHDLRHSFATFCIDADIHMFVLSRALGHSSTAVTEAFYADSMTKRKQLPNKIEQILGSN